MLHDSQGLDADSVPGVAANEEEQPSDLDLVAVGVIVHDPRRARWRVNAAARALLGLDGHDQPRPGTSIVGIPCARRLDEELLGTLTAPEGPKRIAVRHNGDTICRVRCLRRTDAAGRTSTTLVEEDLDPDVTEEADPNCLRVTEQLEATRRQARDFEKVFMTSPALQCILNVDGTDMILNPRWTEVLGWSVTELQKGSFGAVVHPDELVAVQEAMKTLGARDGQLSAFDTRLRTVDGAYRSYRWSAVSDLAAGKIYAVATDITELEQKQAELQRMAFVADRTRNAVVVTDAQARIEWVNPAFTRITGYDAEEVLGRVPGEFLRGASTDPEVAARLDSALSAQQGIQAELLHYRKDGRPFWNSVDVQPVHDDRGQLIHFVAVEMDISESRRLERQLLEAKEEAQRGAAAADEANRAKSEFLACMSHEIRTPLNGVLGMAQLMQATELDPEQRQSVEAILQSGKGLLTLINDILDFSRIEADRMELDAVAYRLQDVVCHVADLAQPSMFGRPLEMQVNLPKALPALVGDAGRVRQVLLNLVGNAVKFTRHGRVTIDVDATPIDDGYHLRISVTDTGPGMSAEVVQRLFEPFVQADASTTRRFGGSGLGLAISKDLVDLMGGRLQVESTLGEGSCFWFELTQPAASGAPDRPVPAGLVESNLAGVRVLLAEDNQINQQVARRMLERLGCAVQIAEDGGEALRQVQAGPFDVVLMDCQMPGMDGYAASRAIRRLDGPVRDIPIVALTANSMKGDRQRCLDAGMNEYVPKPIDMPTLAERLTKLVKRRRETRSA